MRLLASLHKETLLLTRDRGGLVIIFLMPLALALIVTLIQQNAFKAVSDTAVSLVLVNHDTGEAGRYLEERITGCGEFDVAVTSDEAAARKRVTSGEAQVCVVVPPGASARMQKQLERDIQKFFVENEQEQAPPAEPDGPNSAAGITVLFDPAVGDLYKKAVNSALHRLVQGVEVSLTVSALGNRFQEKIEALNRDMLGDFYEEGAGEVDLSDRTWTAERLLPLDEAYLEGSGKALVPTPVQQNVPAWTLFAMFLIVVPLSGSLIKERQQGTLLRLRTMPVRPSMILAGKQLVFLGVCVAQFAMMLFIGVTAMPLLGMPALEVGSHYGAMLAVSLASGLAATGLGQIISVFARSHEQAAMFGATTVVIASALGGIMVPSFLMPLPLQRVSELSPLNWGLSAFLDIFVRDGGLREVLPDTLKLLAFFGATVGVSLFYQSRSQ